MVKEQRSHRDYLIAWLIAGNQEWEFKNEWCVKNIDDPTGFLKLCEGSKLVV